MGIVLPDGWRLVLVEARFDPAAWTRDAVGEDAITRPVWRYRFRVEQATDSARSADDLLAVVDRWKPSKRDMNVTADAFTVVYADMQIGKWEPRLDCSP